MNGKATSWGRNLSVLASLLLTASTASASSPPPNYVGSIGLTVWGVQVEGEMWAHFRFSGGGYAPTEANATSSRGTILSHPYFRISVPEAAELAEGLRSWLQQNHNLTVFRVTGTEIGLSFTGNDGVTWGPEFEPVVILSCMYWLQVQERGESHGEMYMPLPVPQVEALASALETWAANPTATARVPIYALSVQ